MRIAAQPQRAPAPPEPARRSPQPLPPPIRRIIEALARDLARREDAAAASQSPLARDA
jgi:hypothetical protein